MEDEKKTFTGMKENHIEGRNAVLEAFRSGRTIDKLYVLDGFRMFYQPIADTKTGKIRGMEALLRWELEPYGMVSPRCVHGMAGTGPLYF